MTSKRIAEIKLTNQILALVVVIMAIALGIVIGKQNAWIKNQPPIVVPQRELTEETVKVEPIKSDLNKALNQVIANRRSNQLITNQPINTNQLSAILWAMQGITASWGERAVPTTRSAYPLTISMLVRQVEGIDANLYIFEPEKQVLVKVAGFEVESVENVFENSHSLKQAPAVMLLSGSKSKLKNKLDGIEKNELLFYEAGHASQNAQLEAQTLGLSVSPVTQFEENVVSAFKIPEDEIALALLAIGYPQAQ